MCCYPLYGYWFITIGGAYLAERKGIGTKLFNVTIGIGVTIALLSLLYIPKLRYTEEYKSKHVTINYYRTSSNYGGNQETPFQKL